MVRKSEIENKLDNLSESLGKLLFSKYNSYHKLSVYLFVFTIILLGVLVFIVLHFINSGYINRVTAFILGMLLVGIGIVLLYLNLKVLQLVDYWYEEYRTLRRL